MFKTILLVVLSFMSITLNSYKANMTLPVIDTGGVFYYTKNMAKFKIENITPDKLNKAKYVYEKAISNGFDDARALSLLGNIYAESGFNERIVNDKSGAYGLMQWLGDRVKALKAKYGENPSFEDQVDFLFSELSGKRPGWNDIKGSGMYRKSKSGLNDYYQPSMEEWTKYPTLKESVMALNRGFVRPGVHEMNDDYRFDAAMGFGSLLGINMDGVRTGANINYDALKNKFMDKGVTDRRIKIGDPKELEYKIKMSEFNQELAGMLLQRPDNTRVSRMDAYNEAMAEYLDMINNGQDGAMDDMAQNNSQSQPSAMDLYNQFYGEE